MAFNLFKYLKDNGCAYEVCSARFDLLAWALEISDFQKINVYVDNTNTQTKNATVFDFYSLFKATFQNRVISTIEVFWVDPYHHWAQQNLPRFVSGPIQQIPNVLSFIFLFNSCKYNIGYHQLLLKKYTERHNMKIARFYLPCYAKGV